MNTTLTRRTASTVRTTLAIVAFAALAAVGCAAAQSLRTSPIRSIPTQQTAPSSCPSQGHINAHVAPSGAPINAAFFRM